MAKTKLFQYQTASVRLIIWGNGSATVQSLYAVKRRDGQGRKVMEMLIDFADENGLSLILSVGQFGTPEQALDNEGLIKFYESLGFVKWDRANPKFPTIMFRDFS